MTGVSGQRTVSSQLRKTGARALGFSGNLVWNIAATAGIEEVSNLGERATQATTNPLPHRDNRCRTRGCSQKSVIVVNGRHLCRRHYGLPASYPGFPREDANPAPRRKADPRKLKALRAAGTTKLERRGLMPKEDPSKIRARRAPSGNSVRTVSGGLPTLGRNR